MPSEEELARHVVVVGHGMVGHRFVEAMRARDTEARWRITVLAEEADAAYDPVGLTHDTCLCSPCFGRLTGHCPGMSLPVEA